MKILFLTPQMPYPPRQGAALRNWGIIAGLAARHEVSVLSFLAPGQSLPASLERPLKPDDPLRSACRIVTVSFPVRTFRDRLRDMLATRQPDMALRLVSEAYSHRLADWLVEESFVRPSWVGDRERKTRLPLDVYSTPEELSSSLRCLV